MSSSLPAFGSLNGSGTPSWSSNKEDKQQHQQQQGSHANSNNNNNPNTNGSIYQDTARPVDTPPKNPFAFIQFKSSSDNKSLFQRGNNQKTTPTNATTMTTNAMTTNTDTTSPLLGHGHGLNHGQGGFGFPSMINNPITAANNDQSSSLLSFGGTPTLATPTFGLGATSISTSASQPHSQSQMGAASSSSLGLRQRNNGSRSCITGSGSRVGAPPPKRSMMNMNMNMNMNMEKPFQNHAQSEKENQPNNSSSSNGINLLSNSTASTSLKKATSNDHNPNSIGNGKNNHQSIHPFAQNPMDYNQWIILYGFSTSSQCQVILSKFDKLGTVVAKFPSLVIHDTSDQGNANANANASDNRNSYGDASGNGRNWVCIKYESALQADKALCQHGSFMDMNYSHIVTRGGGGTGQQPMIVGVMKMDEGIASRLGLNIFLNEGGVGVGTSPVDLGGERGTHTGMATDMGMDMGRMGSITTRLHERDVLLTSGGDNLKRTGNADADAGLLAKRGSLSYKVLAWVFEW